LPLPAIGGGKEKTCAEVLQAEEEMDTSYPPRKPTEKEGEAE